MSAHVPRPGRPVNPEARERRRQQILDGARRCFMEKGFHAASTADISEAAGVSVANLYQYFPSKQHLIMAIAEQDLERDFERGAAFEEFGSVLDGLEALLSGLMEEAEHRDVAGLRVEIYSEAIRNDEMREALARLDGKLARALARTIERAQQRGEIVRELDPATVADMILRIHDGLYLGTAAGLTNPRTLMPQVMALLRRGFSPPPKKR